MPIIGASTIKATVLMIGSGLIALNPACAIAAPAKPPISVCDEEEGMPYHHVSKFQLMAASSPERTTGSVMNCS